MKLPSRPSVNSPKFSSTRIVGSPKVSKMSVKSLKFPKVGKGRSIKVKV